MSDAPSSAHPLTTADGTAKELTAEEERARQLAQQQDTEQQRQEQERGDEERKQLSSSILSRVLHFSRSPPPSSDADAAAARVVNVLFLSSTNSIVPHIAAAMTNVTHGDHIKAQWSTSSPEGPLVDEPASEAMQEHDVAQHHYPHSRFAHCQSRLCSCSLRCAMAAQIDESDDPMTPFASLSGLAGSIGCVVTLDDVSQVAANTLFPGKPVSQTHLRIQPSFCPSSCSSRSVSLACCGVALQVLHHSFSNPQAASAKVSGRRW